MANLMLWSFQCGSFVEGTFWHALKSRPLNSRLLKMSGSLHKSHLHSLPDTHQTLDLNCPEVVLEPTSTLAWRRVPLTRWGKSRRMAWRGNISYGLYLKKSPSSILFFPKIYILKWLTVKKALSKCSVFTSAVLVKDERGNLWKKRHSCTYLKYIVRMESLSAEGS